MTYTLQKVNLNNPRDVWDFINLHHRIYRGDKQWIPPLRFEMRHLLSKRRNPFFAHSDAGFFIVRDQSGKTVSRLACLNNSRFNAHNKESTAFFYLFESENIPEASTMVFEGAADWARKQGLSTIIGPKGFTPLDGLGLLTEGFNQPQVFGIPYNPPYYPALIEEAGFTSTNRILSGTVDRQTSINPKIEQIARRVRERIGLEIITPKTKKQIRDYWPIVLELYNKAIKGTAGNYPIDAREAKELTRWISWIADPKLIKIITKNSIPVGFLIVYPDVSEAVRRNKGQLLPLGWLDILSYSRRTKTVNINGMGIAEEYRGLGGTAVLFSEIIKSIYESRYTKGELIQVDMDNEKMLMELRNIGVKYHKKHQLYLKHL